MHIDEVTIDHLWWCPRVLTAWWPLGYAVAVPGVGQPATRNLHRPITAGEGPCNPLTVVIYAPGMGFADTERNRAAVHEAGHALIAASRGLAVAVIELHGNDGEGGMRLCETPSELDRVWVLYGGPFAEKVVFKRWASTIIPPEHDELLLAHGLCRQMGINQTVGIRDQIEAYLRDQQVRLEFVAARLLETARVEGADLDKLLREEVGLSRI